MDNIVVINRISELLKQHGKKQKDLTDYLEITPNAFTDWKSGRIKSYNKHLPKIAEYFGVSVDYLLGNPEQKEKPSDEEGGDDVVLVSRNGRRVVHHLSPEQLDILAGMIEQMEKNNNG